MGRARLIRVPGIPADLRIPRHWPTPTDKWVRDNAFWHPPAGWTPVPGKDPAPEGWTYWVANPLWSRAMAPHFRAIAALRRVANGLCVVWVAALIASPFLGYPPPLRALGLLAMLACSISFISYEVLRARTTKRLLQEFAVLAHRGRAERLTSEYQRYLTAVA